MTIFKYIKYFFSLYYNLLREDDQAIKFQLTFLVCESEPFYEQLKL